MVSDILKTAYRERDALQAQLDKNPTWQKMQLVKKLIDAYEAFEGVDDYEPAVQQPSYRHGSKTQMVDEAIYNHLTRKGARASSGELLPIIEAAGIKLGGATPSRTLASFLTNSKRFNNVRGFGYGLVEWGVGLGPNGDAMLRQVDELASMVLGGDESKSSPPTDQPRAAEGAKHGG